MHTHLPCNAKFIGLQVTKVKPNDKDAKAKYTECNKIVKRIAFEKAIAVEDNKKSILESVNVDSMSTIRTFLLSSFKKIDGGAVFTRAEPLGSLRVCGPFIPCGQTQGSEG